MSKSYENTRNLYETGCFCGASDLTRTGDLLITSEMHYRLCYTSVVSLNIISAEEGKVNIFLKNRPIDCCLCRGVAGSICRIAKL